MCAIGLIVQQTRLDRHEIRWTASATEIYNAPRPLLLTAALLRDILSRCGSLGSASNRASTRARYWESLGELGRGGGGN